MAQIALIDAGTYRPRVNSIGDVVSIHDDAVHLGPAYNLNHPDPEDINRWLEESGRYRVYGRYVPD